ncbi:MAG: type II toxin-antitoxin system RelE/ParE family toxin [Deltaproteobacteria bacterium]|nr:type II toxin-antitoxin system RelE/ParE family toxin [Deltaproteobacteria bacterium]
MKAITFAASAVRDLDEIRDWYDAQQAPRAGKQQIEGIIYAAERLVDFPESGRIVPEFGMVNLREVIHPPFRIVYRLDRNRVRIVRVWRSERLLKMA